MFFNVFYQKFNNDKTIYTQDKDIRGLDVVKDFNQVLAMILPDDICLLDIDDQQEAETLLKIVKDKKIKSYVLQTDKGMHFYFRDTKDGVKNGIALTLPIGLVKCDIKTGLKNGKAFLKRNGEWRKWIIGPKPNNEGNFLLDSYDLDEIPYYLIPLTSKRIGLAGMTSGNRNDELIRLKWSLATKYNYTHEQVFETITIINDYVFADKMNQDEIKVICRSNDGAFQAQSTRWYDDKHNFLHEELAEHIGKILYAYTDGQDGLLYIWNGTHYVINPKLIEQEIIKEVPRLKTQQIKEVVNRLSLLEIKNTIEPIITTDKISIKNGILDIHTKKIEPHTPLYFLKNYIDVEYDSPTYDQNVDKFLNDVLVERGDKEQRLIFEEYLGYTAFLTVNEYKKMLLCIGETANNGKTTCLNMVRDFLGDKNTSTLKLFQISDSNQFLMVKLINKLANFDDDSGSDLITGSTMAYLKALTSTNKITINEKHNKNPIEVEIFAKMWVSANQIIRTQQKGNEWTERLLILNFKNLFNAQNRNVKLSTILRTDNAKKYLMKLALDGLGRLMKNGKFTESKTSNEALADYKMKNDSVISFLVKQNYRFELFIDKLVDTMYGLYKEFSYEDNNGFNRNRDNFESSILRYFGDKLVIEVNDKNQRVFRERK